MRVSLIIDGDASGAEKAAETTSRAVGDLGKESAAVSKAIEEGFGKAIGAFEKMSEANKKVNAANDNVGSTAVSVAQKIGDLTSKVLGSDSAFGKAAAGAGSFAAGIAGLARSAGPIGLITGALGLASLAVSAYYQLSSTGSADAERSLTEQARLVGVVKDAYSGAAKSVGEYYTQSKNVTQLQLQQNLLSLRSDLSKASSAAVGSFDTQYSLAGLSQLNNPFSDGSETASLTAFKTAVDGLRSAVATGSPDVKKYQEDIAAIGLAAQKTSPALAKAAGEILEQSKSAGDLTNKVAQTEAALAVLNGTATEQQKKLVGIAAASDQAGNDYDRLTKSLQRQAAAQEAEALTVGKSAGEAAKLRTQYLLNEAAAQSGVKKTEEYAAAVDKLAGRFGAAAQKAAEANLKSNAGFDLSQIGRTSIDANVASQLRGAYGDDVGSQLNGALATSLRFNESMRELKATTFDLASGAFRDIRTEIQAGTSALEIMGKVGVNAFNKIIDKAGDKALDSLISKLFGAASGSSSGGLLSGLAGLFGFDEGGYTGPGGKHEPAGIVHKGEVVWSQNDISRSGGVAVVEAMRRGAPGYTGGGVVGGAPSPLNFMSASSGGNSPAGGAPSMPRIPIDLNVSVDDDGKLAVVAREAGRDGASDAVDLRIRNFSRHELPDRVQEIQQNPRNR